MNLKPANKGRSVSRQPPVSKMELYIKYVNAFITDITKNSILDVVGVLDSLQNGKYCP